YINNALSLILRDFIIVYLNNILVYILDLKKYIFTIKEVKYLSYIIKARA
ncbi:hypothetical protein MYCTH_2061412, partial [Thermothelomyces thermophilus ATCC 42464]